MAATRKLQGEIDRILKKVQEGVDVFDSIWNKVYDTENANQKEKFEADLKKEIKKLQRYRDQIKSWIQSSEIKDKKALLEARKLIEREMERFKICEKETKTKAFSKEGLGQQPKTDPRERAKGEARDWLNTMVGDLELQTDAFEAEMEGLTVKKGKTRPPRLTHLEESISRHKQHIIKLELILRLLDNDELSPEQVNDVKEFVEDYKERNQDDFDEFGVVDDLYQSLPLDKIEALEALEAIPNVAPAIVVKEKAAVAAASGVSAANGVSLKSPVLAPTAQQVVAAAAVAAAAVVAVVQRVSPSSLPLEEGPNPEASRDSGSVTPLIQTGNVDAPTSAVVASVTVAGTVTGAAAPFLPPGSVSITSPVKSLPGTSSEIGLSKPANITSQVPVSGEVSSKEESYGNLRFVGSVGDGCLARAAMGRGVYSAQSPPVSVKGGSLYSSSTAGSNGKETAAAAVSDLEEAGKLDDDRIGTGILSQEVGTPFGSQNRVFGQSGGTSESVGDPEGGMIGSRMFSQSVGGHCRLPTASTFQNQAELGQYQGRTEIAPDQKQKYLQRLQVQQQGQSASLLSTAPGKLSNLSTVNDKSQNALTPMQQSSTRSQLQSFQQHQELQASIGQTFTTQQKHPSLALGREVTHLSVTSSQAQQQERNPHLPISSQQLQQDSAASGAAEHQQQLHSDHKLVEDRDTEVGPVTSFSRSLSMSEEDSKNADTFDVLVGRPGTLADFSELSRDVNFSCGHSSQVGIPVPGSSVIGRRSMNDLGAISSSPPGSTIEHERMFNLQALEAAYLNTPLLTDSERPKNYTPRNPAVTPASYPQVPAPIVENLALWERLETDVLFFSFYFHQGTYQQYLAARELKKQSWRYHKKYNTWFQRHEEPKVTTDEFEQGTYVYFDFHIVHDDLQQGWCQRIKTEFTFEYSFLEDELVL